MEFWFSKCLSLDHRYNDRIFFNWRDPYRLSNPTHLQRRGRLQWDDGAQSSIKPGFECLHPLPLWAAYSSISTTPLKKKIFLISSPNVPSFSLKPLSFVLSQKALLNFFSHLFYKSSLSTEKLQKCFSGAFFSPDWARGVAPKGPGLGPQPQDFACPGASACRDWSAGAAAMQADNPTPWTEAPTLYVCTFPSPRTS